jgi:hypothetical protein
MLLYGLNNICTHSAFSPVLFNLLSCPNAFLRKNWDETSGFSKAPLNGKVLNAHFVGQKARFCLAVIVESPYLPALT